MAEAGIVLAEKVSCETMEILPKIWTNYSTTC